jgi:hypothetical protein
MIRHVTIGPDRIPATFLVFSTYVEELKLQGVPDDAKMSLNTAPDGVVLARVDYDVDDARPLQATF